MTEFNLQQMPDKKVFNLSDLPDQPADSGIDAALNKKADELGFFSNLKKGFQKGMTSAERSQQELSASYQAGNIGLPTVAAGSLFVGAQKLFTPSLRAIEEAVGPTVAAGLTTVVNGINKLQQPAVDKLQDVIGREGLEKFQGSVEQRLQSVAKAYDELDPETKRAMRNVGLGVEAMTAVVDAFTLGAAGASLRTGGRKAVTKTVEAISKKADELAPTFRAGMEAGEEIIDKAGDAAKQKKLAETTTKLEKTAGEIVGGKGLERETQVAVRALADVDYSKAKNFKQLETNIDDTVKQFTKKVDDALDLDTNLYKETQLGVVETVGEGTGAASVKTNYVTKALDELEDLYKKTSAPADELKITQLKTKLKTEGLTNKEINNLAREYARNKNAFNPSTGAPPTSVTKKGYENVRKGIKETSRDLLPDDATRILDGKISDLITTREMVKKMKQQAARLARKFKERGIVEKLSGAAANTIDALLLRGPSGFVSKFFPRGQGIKILNAVELNNRVGSMLKKFDKILKSKSVDESVEGINALLNLIPKK